MVFRSLCSNVLTKMLLTQRSTIQMLRRHLLTVRKIPKILTSGRNQKLIWVKVIGSVLNQSACYNQGNSNVGYKLQAMFRTMKIVPKHHQIKLKRLLYPNTAYSSNKWRPALILMLIASSMLSYNNKHKNQNSPSLVLIIQLMKASTSQSIQWTNNIKIICRSKLML